MLTNIRKRVKKIGWQRDSSPLPVGYVTAVTSNTYLLYKQLMILHQEICASSAVSRKGKNFNYWIEYFPLETVFRRKVISILHDESLSWEQATFDE